MRAASANIGCAAANARVARSCRVAITLSTSGDN